MRLAAVLLSVLVGPFAFAQYKVSIPFTAPNKWALVIGAKDYASLGPLNYSASDAVSVGKALVEGYGFSQEHVRVIADGSAGDKPTGQTILSRLDSMLKDPALHNGDLFVFYFSGHGIGTAKGDYLAASDATLATVESRGLPVKAVVQRIVDSGLKNVLFIADACRSGEKNPFGRELQSLGKKANIAVLLGCEPGGRSYESDKFGQGFFTHALTEAIRNESLRDETTGALWASTVAAKVQTDVKAATAKEFGKEFAQVPSVWTEKTQDVLLGAFVGRGELTQAAMKMMVEEMGEKIDLDGFRKFLVGMSLAMRSEGMLVEAVELLKTWEGLGHMQSIEAYLLAQCLKDLGRDGEAQRLFDRLYRDPNTAEDIKLLVGSSETPTGITAEERRACAVKYWKTEKTVSAAFVLYEAGVVFGAFNEEEILAQVKEFVETFPAGSAGHVFWAGTLDRISGDTAGAVDKALKGIELKDFSEIDRSRWYLLAYGALIDVGDEANALRIVKVARRSKTDRYLWDSIYLGLAGSMEKPDRIKVCHEVLDGLNQASLLPEVVRTAGIELPEVTGKVREAAARFPLAWEARLAVKLCDSIPDFPKSWPITDEDCKHAPSAALFEAEYCFILSRAADFAFIDDKLTREECDRVTMMLVERLVMRVKEFAGDWTIWESMHSVCMSGFRIDQLADIYERELMPSALKGGVPSDVRESMVEVFLSSGRLDTAKKLYDATDWSSDSQAGTGVRLAMSLALAGQKSEALSVLKSAAKGDEESVCIREILLAWLEPGPTDKERIAKLQEITVTGLGENLVTYARSVLGDNTMGGEAQLDMVLNYSRRAMDAHAVYFKFVLGLITSLTEEPDWPETCLAFGRMIWSQPLRVYAPLDFGCGQPQESYLGKLSLKGRVKDVTTTIAGEAIVELELGAKSSTGTVAIAGRRFNFTGAIDKLGNLSGTLKNGSQQFSLSGKLPPYKWSDQFKEVEVAFALTDSNGQVATILVSAGKD